MSDLVFRRACPFPVGSVLMMYANTNPSTLYPGTTWAQACKGRVPLGEGTVEANTHTTHGNTTAGEYTPTGNHEKGGERFHVTSISELPAHGHVVRLWNDAGSQGYAQQPSGGGYIQYGTAGLKVAATAGTWSGWPFTCSQGGLGDQAGTTSITGASAAHNNMPPYETFCFWRRTA